MSKTLEELRTELGRDTALLLEGAASADGTTTTLIDTLGLARFGKDDALNGGILYILGAGGAAPENEWAFITDYAHGTHTVTVEDLFGALPETNDTYEIYRVPLTLDQWDQCINRAILDAWPEVWQPRTFTIYSTGVYLYSLRDDAEEVDKVLVRVNNPNDPDKAYNYPLVRGVDWEAFKNEAGVLRLSMLRPPPESMGGIQTLIVVHYRERYAELAAAGTTLLDPAYIKAAAAANLYGTLADNTRGQADASRYLQLLNYWQEQAQMQKRRLVAGLPQISNPALAQQEKKR